VTEITETDEINLAHGMSIFTARQHSIERGNSRYEHICRLVWLAVMRWYCIETAQARITKSSLMNE